MNLFLPRNQWHPFCLQKFILDLNFLTNIISTNLRHLFPLQGNFLKPLELLSELKVLSVSCKKFHRVNFDRRVLHIICAKFDLNILVASVYHLRITEGNIEPNGNLRFEPDHSVEKLSLDSSHTLIVKIEFNSESCEHMI